mgnify:CR=1 FL=1
MIELPKRSRPDIHADINIVPYIDVMLVLLVIFMMTTPIIEQGVEVDLPSAPANVVDYQDQQPSIISVDVDGNYFINPISKDIMINADESMRVSNLKVNDISSKLVYIKKEVLLPTTINVDFLDRGIYIITMNTVNGEKITKKLILP